MTPSRSGPGRTRATTATQSTGPFTGRFSYLHRPDWDDAAFGDAGGKPGKEPHRVPGTLTPLQVVTVHHTATANADPDPVRTIRAVAREHTRLHGDLGFHLLIDHHGAVYEGCRGGAAVGAQVVSGAHVEGFDPGNVGIALVGDLSTAEPTPDARAALVRVLATLVNATGLDPVGRTTYVEPGAGATREVPVISTLADWSDDPQVRTSLEALAPELRAAVASLLLG